MYFTVYKTTNLINGKIYVGVHKTDNLDDGYLGSGVLISRAIEKYGKDNFCKDIIAIFDNEEEMYKLEESLVCQAFLTFFSTYNLKVGGDGGFDFVNNSSLNGSRKGVERRIELFKDKEFRDKFVSDRRRSTTKFRKENPNFYKPHENFVKYWKGRTHSEETIYKMKQSSIGKHVGTKNSQFGTRWITNGISNKKIRVSDDVPEGWRNGRVVSIV